MPFIQKQNIREPNPAPFRFDNFDGGLVNVGSPLTLKDNESPKLMNVMSFEPNIIEVRPGLFKYILEQIPEEINRIFSYETDSFEYFLFSSATKLYKVPVAGGTPVVVCNVANVISGVQYEDKFYFVDGQKFRRYDGTDVLEVIDPIIENGKAQAGTSSGIQLESTAHNTVDYYKNWYITITSGTGLGQARRIVSNDTTRLCTVDSAWATQPDNTSVYYLTKNMQKDVAIDSNAKTISYTPSYQEFGDTFKGGNNIGMANKCTQITLHKQRVVFTGDSSHKNMVYYTSIDNPVYVPVNQWIPPVTNDDDVVTGIKSFNDVLIMTKNRTIFALYGYDETDFDLKEVTVSCGTTSPESIKQLGNELIYLGSNGIVYALYDVRTDYKKLLTKDLTTGLIDLQVAPIKVYADEWTGAKAVVFKDRYYLAVKDKMLVLNTNKRWWVWDSIEPTAMLTYRNDLLLMNSKKYVYRLALNRFFVTESFTATDGQTNFTVQKGYLGTMSEDVAVYINNVVTTLAEKQSLTTFTTTACTVGDVVRIEYLSQKNYNDDGDAYDAYYYTKDYDFGDPSAIKQFRKIWLTCETYRDFTSNIDLYTVVDYDEVFADITIQNQMALWGKAKFGLSRFISRNKADSEPIQINRRGKTIAFKFSGGGFDNPFKLYKINGHVVVRVKY